MGLPMVGVRMERLRFSALQNKAYVSKQGLSKQGPAQVGSFHRNQQIQRFQGSTFYAEWLSFGVQTDAAFFCSNAIRSVATVYRKQRHCMFLFNRLDRTLLMCVVICGCGPMMWSGACS